MVRFSDTAVLVSAALGAIASSIVDLPPFQQAALISWPGTLTYVCICICVHMYVIYIYIVSSARSALFTLWQGLSSARVQVYYLRTNEWPALLQVT